MKYHRTTDIKLTAKGRKILIKAYAIIDKFGSKISEEAEEKALSILMRAEDAKVIKELGDLATDIYTTYY